MWQYKAETTFYLAKTILLGVFRSNLQKSLIPTNKLEKTISKRSNIKKRADTSNFSSISKEKIERQMVRTMANPSKWLLCDFTNQVLHYSTYESLKVGLEYSTNHFN